MKEYIPDDHDYGSKSRFARRVTVTTYISLLVWFTAWHLIIDPAPTAHPWVIWLIHVLPLLAFAHVIISGKPRGHAWLCFVLLLIFTMAVQSAFNPNTFIYGLGYSIMVAILFTSSMMYARWNSRYNKQLAHWKKQETTTPESDNAG